jgi:hypothetical protein
LLTFKYPTVDVKYEGEENMTNNPVLYKSLVVGVIVLFVGVGIQPAFADISIKSDNSELEKITIQFFETDRTYNHTVLLTQEEVRKLDNLITNFNNRLESVDNPTETETIFKNTVVSFYNLGLLPKDVKIEDAQRLVTGMKQNPSIVKSLERWVGNHRGTFDDNENFLCLISGNTKYTIFQGPTGRIFYSLMDSFLVLLEKMFYNHPILHSILLEIIIHPIIWFMILSTLFWNTNPLPIGYEIGLGYWSSPMWFPPHYSPAEGWVKTLGLNGKKIWEGEFFGKLPIPGFLAYLAECYTGVLGFTGLKIGLFDSHFYMGSALWVKIGEDPPVRV